MTLTIYYEEAPHSEYMIDKLCDSIMKEIPAVKSIGCHVDLLYKEPKEQLGL